MEKETERSNSLPKIAQLENTRGAVLIQSGFWVWVLNHYAVLANSVEEERANIVEQIKSLVSMRAAKEGRLGGFSYLKKKEEGF